MDVPIFVTALGLYGSLHGAFEYETNIEVTNSFCFLKVSIKSPLNPELQNRGIEC